MVSSTVACLLRYVPEVYTSRLAALVPEFQSHAPLSCGVQKLDGTVTQSPSVRDVAVCAGRAMRN